MFILGGAEWPLGHALAALLPESLRCSAGPIEQCWYSEVQVDHRARGSTIKRLQVRDCPLSIVCFTNGHCIWRGCPWQVRGLCWWPLLSWPPDTVQPVRVNAPWRQRQEPPLKFGQTPRNGSRRQGIMTVNHEVFGLSHSHVFHSV